MIRYNLEITADISDVLQYQQIKNKLKSPKAIFLMIGLVALVLAIFFGRDQLGEAVGLIGDVRWPYLLLVPFFQLINYFGVAKHHQHFLGSFKLKPSFRKLFGLAFAMNFVNSTAPSLGASGASFFTYSLTQDKVPAGKSTLTYASRYILMYLAFVIVLAVGVLALYFSADIARITVRILVLLALGILALNAWFIYEFSQHNRFDKLVRRLFRIVDKLGIWLRKDNQPLVGHDRIERALREFHSGFDIIRKHRRRIIAPFLWMLVSATAEVMTLYAVLVAFGSWLNPGAVIFAYALGNLAGFLAAVVPAGLGAYEASMVTAFAATGVPLALALSVTVLYRTLNMALFLPVGFYFYQKYIRDSQSEEVKDG